MCGPQVEDARRVLLLHGNKSSQVLKDVFIDLQKLKWVRKLSHDIRGHTIIAQMESVKYTRKNQDVRPFEAGGEVSIEHWARKGDCTMFAFASHTKKRPHNLVRAFSAACLTDTISTLGAWAAVRLPCI